MKHLKMIYLFHNTMECYLASCILTFTLVAKTGYYDAGAHVNTPVSFYAYLFMDHTTFGCP